MHKHLRGATFCVATILAAPVMASIDLGAQGAGDDDGILFHDVHGQTEAHHYSGVLDVMIPDRQDSIDQSARGTLLDESLTSDVGNGMGSAAAASWSSPRPIPVTQISTRVIQHLMQQDESPAAGGTMPAYRSGHEDMFPLHVEMFNLGMPVIHATAVADLQGGQRQVEIDLHERGPMFGSVNAIPEPGSWAMMITGFGLLGIAARRRRAAATA